MLAASLQGALRRQEVAYNLGRAFHHLDLVHLALPWYERALAVEDAAVAPRRAELLKAIDRRRRRRRRRRGRQQGQEPKARQNSASFSSSSSSSSSSKEAEEEAEEERLLSAFGDGGSLSVVPDCAHNLVLIYQTSGNQERALDISHRYFPVI